MSSWQQLLSYLGPELKGALAGGLAAAILDRGRPLLSRVFNFMGAVTFGFTVTPGVVATLALFNIKGGEELSRMVAVMLALIGLIVAEFIQRVAKHVLLRSDTIADRIIDRITPEDKDK